MTDLQSLREMLEKAGGPDREIDETIHTSLVEEWPELGGYYGWERRAPGYISQPIDSEGRQHRFREAPRYTASLDAAISLVERVLPEYTGFIGFEPGTETWLWHSDGGSKEFRVDVKSTPALALLTAMAQALIQEKENET